MCLISCSNSFRSISGRMFDQTFDQIFDQVCDQIFGQGFGEGNTINTVYRTTRPKENSKNTKK